MVQAGGGALPNFYLCNFKVFFAATSWVAAKPLPPPVALRCPFQGNVLIAHIMGNSRCARFVMIRAGGGALPNFYLNNFEGFFGWLYSQQSTGFIGRKDNSSGVGKIDVGRYGDVNCDGDRGSNSDS